MRALLYILILGILLIFTACKKDLNDNLQNVVAPSNKEVPVDNVEPIPAPAWKWVQLPVPTDIIDHVSNFNEVIEVNNNVYCLIGFSVYKMLYKFNSNTKSWTRSFDFPLYPDSRILFAYQSKIYVGLSNIDDNISNDFKSYDLSTGITTILPSFPGTPVGGAIHFVIGNKGYLLGGETHGGHNSVNQFWEFNFSTNQWTNKGNSPIGARVDGASYVMNGKAYIGLGYYYITINGQQAKIYKKDWVLYDPGSIFLTIKADFPGLARQRATGFILGDYPYVGLGRNDNGNFKDFYKYNPNLNTWVPISDWPGNFYLGNDCEGFSVGDSGYIVSGAFDEFWRYYNSLFAFQ